MDDRRYVQADEKFLGYAFQALRDHFTTEGELRRFYGSIETDRDRSLFLKTCSFYLFFVKQCSITNTVPGVNNDIDYVSNTLKFIAMVSLIESLDSKGYRDFYHFLVGKDNNIEFPIHSTEQLCEHYKNYKKRYGATQKTTAFFRRVEDPWERRMKGKVQVLTSGDKEKLTINEFAKLLYHIRSEFMHEARMVLEFGNHPVLSRRKKKTTFTNVGIHDLMWLFEKGLLKFFERPRAHHEKGDCAD